MIDLEKLEQKFQNLFEKETPESFNLWLEDKMKRESLSRLGVGEIEKMKIPAKQEIDFLCPNFIDFGIDQNTSIVGNAQFAMAA